MRRRKRNGLNKGKGMIKQKRTAIIVLRSSISPVDELQVGARSVKMIKEKGVSCIKNND